MSDDLTRPDGDAVADDGAFEVDGDNDLITGAQSQWIVDLAKAEKGIKAILASNHRKILELTKDVKLKEESQENTIEKKPSETTVPLPKLEDEPPDGLLIAVQIPEQPRISRRFNPDSPAQQVFIWVASRPELADKELDFNEFELIGPQNTSLDGSRTLREQNVVNRTIFNFRATE